MNAVSQCHQGPPHCQSTPRRPAKRRRVVVAAAHRDQQQLAVVGGGAAGLTAAYFAAEAGAKVTVYEKNAEPGKKILISGGTRCNVLPGSVDVGSDFFTESSQSALRAVFSRWSREECQEWLADPQQVGIQLELEPETNKLFPASNSAREVRDRLVSACRRRGVEFVHGAALAGLQKNVNQPGWDLLCRGGSAAEQRVVATAERVVLATGGLSFPTLGADGVGFRICAAHGHTLHPTYPALTPLLGSHPGGEQLAGISVYDAQLACVGNKATGGKRGKGAGASERTALLLTHRGWSGPAVLDLSHHVVMALERGQLPPELQVRWCRSADTAAWEDQLGTGAPNGSAIVSSLLRRQGLPARLADALCLQAGLPPGRRVAELRKAERAGLLEALTRYHLPVTGHEGYGKAEVTGGGVPLSELDLSSMESRKMPGVHLCGEVCDVHGRIGGFNFFWAWSSGRLAGLGAAGAESSEKKGKK